MATPALSTVTTFTIDDVDYLPYLLVGYTSEAYASGRQVAKFPIVDRTGTLTVPDLAEVVLEVDGVVEFTGVVWDIQTEQFGDVIGARMYTLQCVDWSFCLDTTLINGIYTGPTLGDLLGIIIANAALFGVTLDSAQEDGPTLPAQAWNFLTLRQAIDRVVSLQTGWMWSINPDTREFRAYEPYSAGIPTAPRLFDETSPEGSGLFELRVVKDFNRYINSGYIRYGPSGPAYVTEHITGNGTDSTFTLSHTYLQMNATGTLTHTISGTPAIQTVSEDGSAMWTLDRASNSLIRNAGPVANGDTVDFEFLAQYPQYYLFADSGGITANGPFQTVVSDESILTEEEAIILGEGILRRNGGPYNTITFKTHYGAGFRPLMAITVHCPSIGVTSADEYLISEVQCREIAITDVYGTAVTGSYFEWTITAQAGLTLYDRLDELRGDPAPTATEGAAGPPTTDPVSLFPVVQARAKGHNTVDTTSHAITLPGGIQAGELLLVVFTTDEAPTVTVDTGVSGSDWTLLISTAQSTNVRGVILHKIADGGGTDVLTLTTSTSQQSSHISMRITGHQESVPISSQSLTDNGSNPNPPALTPATGQRSYLWIACRCGDSNANVATAQPSGYSNFFQEVGSLNGSSTATAERLLNASTEDPGAWTSGLAFSVVFTLAVRPPA